MQAATAGWLKGKTGPRGPRQGARVVQGILFDKDGTLFHFGATWNAWAQAVLADLAQGCETRAQSLAAATRFDRASGAFHPDSPVIAGTNREVAELLASALPGRSLAEIEALLIHHASTAPQAQAVPLAPYLSDLRGRGLRLGVMTNDAEAAALAHLDTAKVRHLFDFIAGFDSGYGAKPAPDPLLAFAAAMGLAPGQVVMVGDSTHDLIAGRAAGMKTIAVLTGMAGPAELSPLADAVLPDIGHIPAWLQAQGWA